MTETFSVSLALRYACPTWSVAKNLEIYGSDASLEGLGANFEIALTWKTTEPSVKPLAALEFVKSLLDHRCLFKDEPEFAHTSSTLENITLFVVKRLQEEKLRHSIDWVLLQVRESQNLSAVYDFKSASLSLTLDFQFPIQWKTRAGRWGGGEWKVQLELAKPLDKETGLLLRRLEKWQEIEGVISPFASRTSIVEDDTLQSIEGLVAEVANGIRQINGFKSVSIAPQASQSYRFYG